MTPPPRVQGFVEGRAKGRSEALEHVVGVLRRKAASWRAQEAKRGMFAAALLWSFTEHWLARIEGLAVELEAHAAQLRLAELAAAPAGKKERKRNR